VRLRDGARRYRHPCRASLFASPWEAPPLLMHRPLVSAASDAMHLDGLASLEGTRAPRFRSVSAASVTAVFSMPAKKHGSDGRSSDAVWSTAARRPGDDSAQRPGKAEPPCLRMPRPRRSKRLPADRAA
jgi:hypothetical protein